MGFLDQFGDRKLRRQPLLPPRLGELTMPAEFRARIIEHVLYAGDDECCGVLGVVNQTVMSHHRIDNVSATPYVTYAMDGKQLMLSMREIEDAGGEPAFYHSHSHSPARPSPTDMRLAYYPDSYYLIASPHTFDGMNHPSGDEPVVRAFGIYNRSVRPWGFFRSIQYMVSEEPIVIAG